MSGQQHVLYRFYSNCGDLLYIGITNDPLRRFSQHQSDKEWWSQVTNICQQSFQTREALQDAEKRAIQNERPLYNKHYAESCNAENELPVLPPGRALDRKWFHSWRELDKYELAALRSPRVHHPVKIEVVRGGKAIEWQGQVLESVSEDLYLIQLYSWWSGQPSQQQMIGLSDMRGWTFYSSNIEMVASTGCCEIFRDNGISRRCGRSVVGIAGHTFGMTIAVCAGCASSYSDVRELVIHKDGVAREGKLIKGNKKGISA